MHSVIDGSLPGAILRIERDRNMIDELD